MFDVHTSSERFSSRSYEQNETSVHAGSSAFISQNSKSESFHFGARSFTIFHTLINEQQLENMSPQHPASGKSTVSLQIKQRTGNQ